MGLAPILFNWNHFSPFITLPVSETYLRLRSVGERGKKEKGSPSLSSLDTFKIHKSRGLGFLSASPHNNETSNILCKNSWQGIFFFPPLLLHFALSKSKYIWREGSRARSFLTGADGHKSDPITSHAYSRRPGERGASHLYSHVSQRRNKAFQYASRLFRLAAEVPLFFLDLLCQLVQSLRSNLQYSSCHIFCCCSFF